VSPIRLIIRRSNPGVWAEARPDLVEMTVALGGSDRVNPVVIKNMEQLDREQRGGDLVKMAGEGGRMHGGVAMIVAGQQEIGCDFGRRNLVDLAGLRGGVDGGIARFARDDQVIVDQQGGGI